MSWTHPARPRRGAHRVLVRWRAMLSHPWPSRPLRRPLSHVKWALLAPLCLALACLPLSETTQTPGRAVLLVSNSRGNNVVKIDEQTGEVLGDFISAGSGGLVAPDSLVVGPDGALYVSSGDSPENSAVLRYDGSTGNAVGSFASGNGLVRPYGLAFGPDNRLYVSSFLSDQILRFDARTGAFVDIFATGDGKPGGLNGPNGLAFGPDGKLYVATEGSVAVNGEPTFPGLPSQVLRYDIQTRAAELFIDQPALSSAGEGYVSLLGVVFGPDCGTQNGACDLFVSDYANDLRRYDVNSRALLATLGTNYSDNVPSTDNIGGLVFGTDATLYTVGFDSDSGQGAVLRFDGRSDVPRPSTNHVGAIFVPPDARLVRPIGITFTHLPQ